MFQKNEAGETIVVGLSALFIIGWISTAAWLFSRHVDFKRASGNEPDQTSQLKPSASPTQPNQPTPVASASPTQPNQSTPVASVAQPNQPTPVESFAKVQNVPSGKFNYSGSAIWEPIRQVVEPEIQTAWPPFQLSYTQPTSSKLNSDADIEMLLKNELAFALSSRAIKNEEQQQASQSGFTLKEIPVAIDGIAIAVHPTLNIPGLTIAQLKDIYVGKIINWNQVGGPDMPIIVYSGKEDSGTIDFFVANVLGGESFGANIEFIPTTKDALERLASTTGGIYYGWAPQIVRRCDVKPLPIGVQANELIAPYKEPAIPAGQCSGQRNQINVEVFKNGKYPIARQLSVVIKQNGKEEQRAGEAYSELLLTNRGQEIITTAGFINIR